MTEPYFLHMLCCVNQVDTFKYLQTFFFSVKGCTENRGANKGEIVSCRVSTKCKEMTLE